MERSVAIKKLGKMLGKSLGYRIDANAPTVEEREAAKTALAVASAEKRQLEEKKNIRCREVLAADAEYQKIWADWKAASERVTKLASTTIRHKITVGTSTDMFFWVKAQGDSWEEVIEKLTKKQNVAA